MNFASNSVSLLLVMAVVLAFCDSTKQRNTDFYRQPIKDGDSTKENTIFTKCGDCRTLQKSITNRLLTKTSLQGKASLKVSVKNFCVQFLSDGIEDPNRFCDIIGDQYLTMKHEILDQGPDFCGLSGICNDSSIVQVFGNGAEVNISHQEYIMAKGSPKRRHIRDTDAASTGKVPITFVQISDIHLDFHYQQGSSSFCEDKICCRKETQGSGFAGRFGDYRCDSVKETVDVIMKSIKELNPRPDFFVYAGDNPPHSTGHETLRAKLMDNKAINELLGDSFRSIGPIYPTIGNHDVYPENLYYSKGRTTKTVLSNMAEQWSEMFDVSADQRDNIRRHGFYTTIVKPGLRILSINSLYAYTLNYLAFLSLVDPVTKAQTDFIEQTLWDAQRNSEKVILISHMKPSHVNTYAGYTRKLERIVKRFQDTIILMLFGHEHTDTFVVSTDPDDRNKVTGAFLAAPSVTPYIYYSLGTNPSYRVFTLDPDTFTPLDYHQYFVNLEQANENNSVTVEKHYSFTEEYNLPDLQAESFKQLASRIAGNWQDFQRFERNKDVLAARGKRCKWINILCRRRLTCQTIAATKFRYYKCLFGLK